MNSVRIEREKKTVSLMIGMFCRHNHQSADFLCDECLRLAEYAEKRAQNCRFGNQKPVCARCPVHCYKPEMRENIRKVMRYSGPRMMTRHPYLAIMHFVDKKRFSETELN